METNNWNDSPYVKQPHHVDPQDVERLFAHLSGDCQHPNAYYHGDTSPPTYQCPDCGATFIKD